MTKITSVQGKGNCSNFTLGLHKKAGFSRFQHSRKAVRSVLSFLRYIDAPESSQSRMLVHVLTIAACAAVTTACNCGVKNPDDYCGYYVVLFGEAVSKRMETTGDKTARVYTFDVIHQFKPFNENNGKTIQLRTKYTRMSCDTSILLNQRVFLTAKEHKGQLWFYICDPMQYWDLPNQQDGVAFIRDTVVPHCGLQGPDTPRITD